MMPEVSDELMQLLAGDAALPMPATLDRDGVAGFVAPIKLRRTCQIGATASVFHASFPDGQPCIVKAYRQAYDRAGAGALEMERVRFEVRAARTAAHLPGLLAPACFATRRQGALIYTLWAPAKGASLGAYPSQKPLPPLPARHAMAQSLITAVQRIHDAGLLHLDLKPEHIFIEPLPPYRVQIIDWGQARYAQNDPRPDRVTFATPAYTRPERLAGSTACAHDDWYAVDHILIDTLNLSLD